MNAVIEQMLAHRSIREFTDDPVNESTSSPRSKPVRWLQPVAASSPIPSSAFGNRTRLIGWSISREDKPRSVGAEPSS